MDLGLTGKVALVTGSSRGIGRGVALTLAEEGCDIMLTGRDEAALREVVGEVEKRGRKAHYETTDLRANGAAAALVEAVKRRYGRLDILVNNAGTTKRGVSSRLTGADWQEGYALKFFAHVRLSRAAWPLLKDAKVPRSPSAAPAAASDRRLHHRQLGERRLRRLRQGAGRSR
jgi:3-oxoacyl-[acyl-carrier protein] reductase